MYLPFSANLKCKNYGHDIDPSNPIFDVASETMVKDYKLEEDVRTVAEGFFPNNTIPEIKTVSNAKDIYLFLRPKFQALFH